jgi:hypothetical protein
MVKAIIKSQHGNDMLFLGFNERSMQLLKLGQPLRLEKFHNLQYDIVLMYAATNNEIEKCLKNLFGDNDGTTSKA